VHEIEEEGESANTEIPGKGRRKGSHIIFYIALFSLLFSAAQAEAQGTTKKSEMTGNPPTEAAAPDVGSGGRARVETEPDRADRHSTGGAERAGPQDRAFELLPQVQMGATEQWERLKYSRAVWRRRDFSGSTETPRSVSHLFHGAVLQWTDS